jgi:hypothetical protein
MMLFGWGFQFSGNHLSTFRCDIFEGFVSSIGCLSESVCKQSSSCLLQWAREQKASKNKRQLGMIHKCALLSVHSILFTCITVLLGVMLRLIGSLFQKYSDSNRELVGLYKVRSSAPKYGILFIHF